MLLIRADDIKEQYQKHRTDGVAVYRGGGPPKPVELAGGKSVLDYILRDKRKAQPDYCKHYNALLPAYIGVQRHGDGKTDQ